MKLALEKVSGRIDDRHWGQWYEFWPDDKEMRERKGKLIVAAGLMFNEDYGQMKMVEWGREALTVIQAIYFRAEGKIESELKQAGLAVVEKVPQFEGVIAVVKGNKWHFLRVRGGGVWVRMGQKEGWILPAEGEEEMTYMEGEGKVGQLVVMGNGEFWKKVPMGMLKSGLESEDENLLKLLEKSGTLSGGEAGAIMQVVEIEAEVVQAEVRAEPQKTAESQSERIEEKRKINLGNGQWQKIKETLMRKNSGVYLPVDKSKQQKMTTLIGVGLVVILLVMMVVGKVQMQKKAEKENNSNTQVTAIMDKYLEAKAIAGLNPVRSRELIDEITLDLEAVTQAEIKDGRIAEIKSGIETLRDEASGKKQLMGSEVIDLGLVREGMTGDKLVWNEGYLWVLDTTGGRLVQVTVSKKSGEVIWGKEDIGGAKIMAGYPTKLEVLASKGIVEWKSGQKAKVVVASDSEWGKIVDMIMFAGNIYLLDSGKGEIWRYAISGSGFADKNAWLAKDEEIDLTGAVRMTVDGSIWVASQNGEIGKITRGVKDTWQVTGMPDTFGEVAGIYTNEDLEEIYVWDKGRSRIVVIKKTGVYSEQYINESLGRANDFTVDGENKKVYWVEGGKVWEGEL